MSPMTSNPIYYSLIVIGILFVFGISFWSIKKCRNKENVSILDDEEKSIMVVDKKLFSEIKSNKSIKCKMCDIGVADATCKCEFSTIKCPVDKTHLFHYECFIKAMGKPSKCPVCSTECLKEFHMFTGDLCRSLLRNENIPEKFNLLRQQVNLFESTLAVFLLDEAKFNMNEVNKVAENLEKNSCNNEMVEFAKVLRKCGKMSEIFEKSKRELFNEIIAGRYQEEAFYPIYFNSNHEMIQELTGKDIVQLLSIYSLNDNDVPLDHRLAYLTIFLTRMYLGEKQFQPEDMKELLLTAIRNKNILSLGVIWNYLTFQPYLNFEKFYSLLDEAIKNIDEKDLPFVIGILKDYYKNISLNILEIFKLFIQNENEYVKDAVYSLFTNNPVKIDYSTIKEILNLYVSTKTPVGKLSSVLIPSIFQILTLKQFEELLNEFKSYDDRDAYIQLQCAWFIKNPPDIDRLKKVLDGKEITDMIYQFGYNEVIDVSEFIELINSSEKKTVLKIIEGGEFFYQKMNEKEIEYMESKCRNLEIVDHLVFFIHRMTPQQTLNLSDSDVDSIMDGAENIKIDSKSISILSNVFDSILLYMKFPELMIKLIEIVNSSNYGKVFKRAFENQHFKEYVNHKLFSDFIYKVIEHPNRKEILRAVFDNCDEMFNYILLKLHLVGRLITTNQEPRGNSDLDEVLREYDINTYMNLFKKDNLKFVSIMKKIDNNEIIERIGEIKIEKKEDQ